MQEDTDQVQKWLRQNPGQEREWLRQNSLIYGGLIAIGAIMVQPFITATSLDLSAKICVIAFAAAIPVLAALIVVNHQEAFRGRRSKSRIVNIALVFGQLGAFIGVVAGFWHILWIAGVVVLACGVVGMAVFSAGYTRLTRQ